MSKIYKALADFQQEVPVIHKETKGYGYSYADLPTIFEVINPLLKKNGLGFTQLVNGYSIKTILFHIESGDTIESETNIPQGVDLKGMNDFQVLGSAITYIRRYALSSILGLVTDKDTDAGGVQNKTKKLEDKEIKVIIGKITASTSLEQLTEIFNSDVRVKTNREIMNALSERKKQLTE